MEELYEFTHRVFLDVDIDKQRIGTFVRIFLIYLVVSFPRMDVN